MFSLTVPMTRTVSQILQEDHQIVIRPGAKGECPKCQGQHFSVKADDSLGEMFQPALWLFPHEIDGRTGRIVSSNRARADSHLS